MDKIIEVASSARASLYDPSASEPAPIYDRGESQLVGDPEDGDSQLVADPDPDTVLREYVALYDRACLEAKKENLRAALFKEHLSERTQRYQADIVPISEREARQIEAELRQDPCLVAFVPNRKVHTVSEMSIQEFTNEPLRDQQQHIDFIKAKKMWDILYTKANFNKKVVVGVIDTGIQLSHEDLKANLWRDSSGNAGKNFINTNRTADDDHNHGTHVAGLIGADGINGVGGIGVAPKGVQLMALKALGASGGGNIGHIVNAVNYAAENGAHVVNMSLGAPGKVDILGAAIQNAVASGTFVLAAAGNDNRLISAQTPYSPMMYAKDIAGFVSVGSQDVINGNRSSFSNYSSTYVEIFGPGAMGRNGNSLVGLLSTVRGGYGRAAGTSMSTPVVAGAVALLYRAFWERGLNPTPQVIEGFLLKYAEKSAALANFGMNGNVLDMELLAQGIKDELDSGACR